MNDMSGGETASSSCLVLQSEHVKLRSSSSGRSPIGTVQLFVNRVEWHDASSNEQLVVPFEKIRGQRVSPPQKSKTQLQLCLLNGDAVTLLFASPGIDRDGHLKQRDLLKDTLQQLLIAQRHAANKQLSVISDEEKRNAEMEQKRQLLRENKQLQSLYTHLVTTNLISPADFWIEHFVQKDSTVNDVEQLGVSNGFLSNITQVDGCNDVKVNLTSDTIQSIFRTYPSVPHEMNEQQFWGSFFRSHYFHRDRTAMNTSNPIDDPFAQCLRVDDADMQAMMETGVLRKRFDITATRDAINLMEEQMDVDIPSTSSSTDVTLSKSLLLKRFNYHSGRVLATHLQIGPVENKKHVDVKTTSNGLVIDEEGDRMELESDELRFVEEETERDGQMLNLHDETNRLPSTRRQYDARSVKNWKQLITDVMDNDLVETDDASSILLLPHNNATIQKEQSGSFNAILLELEPLHDSLVVLLRHFWTCIPPQTAQAEQKLEQMMETLRKFELSQMIPARNRLGKVQTLFEMLQMAYNRYEKNTERKTMMTNGNR